MGEDQYPYTEPASASPDTDRSYYVFLDHGRPIAVTEASAPAPGAPASPVSAEDAWRDMYTPEEEHAARARGVHVVHVDHATYRDTIYPLVHGQAAADDRTFDEAQREWQRLSAVPLAARVELVADRGWQSAYSAAYPTAYTATAARIAAAATDAVAITPGAWLTLQPLAVAAGDAITRLNPAGHAAPPADRRTVASAHAAAQTAIDTGRQPATAVADIARSAGSSAGTLAGTLAATTDVLIGWRARGGEALAGELAIDGKPSRVWVADLLANTNRDTAAAHLPPRATPGAARLTAAQLARQDQATDIAAATTVAPPASAGRHRANAAGSGRHRRSR